MRFCSFAKKRPRWEPVDTACRHLLDHRIEGRVEADCAWHGLHRMFDGDQRSTNLTYASASRAPETTRPTD